MSNIKAVTPPQHKIEVQGPRVTSTLVTLQHQKNGETGVTFN